MHYLKCTCPINPTILFRQWTSGHAVAVPHRSAFQQRRLEHLDSDMKWSWARSQVRRARSQVLCSTPECRCLVTIRRTVTNRTNNNICMYSSIFTFDSFTWFTSELRFSDLTLRFNDKRYQMSTIYVVLNYHHIIWLDHQKCKWHKKGANLKAAPFWKQGIKVCFTGEPDCYGHSLNNWLNYVQAIWLD